MKDNMNNYNQASAISDNDRDRDLRFMDEALSLARQAAALGEVPVGAVVIEGDRIIAGAFNMRETGKNALLHAELDAIRLSCERLGGWRLSGCELFVTLEPCPMCAGAIINARIKRVVYGAKDSRAGAFGSVMNMNMYPLNHKPQVIAGVREAESRLLLRSFFLKLREHN